jgi:hypothetical protein
MVARVPLHVAFLPPGEVAVGGTSTCLYFETYFIP